MLKLLETPYGGEEPEPAPEGAEPEAAGGWRAYASKPPLWAAELCVT